MQYHTLVESDGKAVYIVSGSTATRTTRLLLALAAGALVIAFALLPFLLSFDQFKKYAVLWLLWPVVIGYVFCDLLIAAFLKEEVTLNTHSITSLRKYGPVFQRQKTVTYPNGLLSTAFEPISPLQPGRRVTWYTEDPDTKKYRLLYRHYFPMLPADYEQARFYVQELFDLEDDSESFELLFSAN